MRAFKLRITVIGTLASLLIAAARPAAATTKAPSTTRAATTTSVRKAPSDAAVSAVRAAVIILSKEYEQYLRSPAASQGVRESSNFFLDHPDDAVTPDAIASVLAGRSGDPRTTAYIRWQLLSGIPTDHELDADVSKQLLWAYRNAPQPLPRPGISPPDRQKLDVYAQGRKIEEAPDLNAYLDTAISQVARQNNVILMYRDELYRRLPKSPETFAAVLDDFAQRLSAVADAKDLAKMFAKDVREWAAVEPRPPHQMLALAKAMRRLAATDGPQYYTSATWQTKSNRFNWNKGRRSVDGASGLKDLAVHLEDLAQQPVLEIKDKKD